MRLIRRLAAACAIALATMAGPAAANVTTKDASGVTQTFCTFTVLSVQYSCQVLHGVFGGAPVPLLLDASGNLANLPLPSGASTSTLQSDLIARIGETQASPTSNTVQDRLKRIETRATALEALIGEVSASPTANTVADRLKTANANLVLLQGYLDGVEGLIGTTNTSLTTLDGHVDQLEGYLDQVEGYVDGLEGYVDGIETLLTAGNVSLASIDISDKPFAPKGNASLSTTTSSARVALPTADTTVVVQNTGTALTYFKFTNVAGTAATTDTPILPGQLFVLNPEANTYIAGITASGSSTLKITSGTGRLGVGIASDLSTVSDVNLSQVAGATVATGSGTASGAQRVELPTNGTGKVGLNAGSALIGSAGIDQTTPGTTNHVDAGLSAATTGGCTPYGLTSAASTNSTNVKASAGTLCSLGLVNTTATLYYLRLYNASSAPTCSSATNFVLSIPIPASTSGAGVIPVTGSFGWAFTTGISFCLTGGGSSTDNTNAATGVYILASYK